MPNKILAWVQTHKPQAAIAGGAVGAVGIGLYRKRKAAAGGTDPTTAAGVPTSATTAAGVAPGGGDSAAGMPFDSSAFDMNASSYLAQNSELLSTLNSDVAGLSTSVTALGGGLAAVTSAETLTNKTLAGQGKTLATIARQTKPHTGGTAKKPKPAPKPKAKHPVKHPVKHPAAPVHHAAPPPPKSKRKTVKKTAARKPASRARL